MKEYSIRFYRNSYTPKKLTPYWTFYYLPTLALQKCVSGNGITKYMIEFDILFWSFFMDSLALEELLKDFCVLLPP